MKSLLYYFSEYICEIERLNIYNLNIILPAIPRPDVELGNVLVEVLEKRSSGHERWGGGGVGHQGKRTKIFG